MCLGLKYLHDRDVIHNDLKPQNVLMMNEDYLKLADFGMTRKLIDGKA